MGISRSVYLLFAVLLTFSTFECRALDNGATLAQQLNARYFDTRPKCGQGEAAYHCNGVLVRGTVANESQHAWNPSEHSIENGAVAFSYLRFDVRSRFTFRGQGIVFGPLGSPTNSEYPVRLRCIYPIDSGTAEQKNPCSFNGVCLTIGVITIEKWLEFVHTNKASCAFADTPEQFQLSIDVRPYSNHPHAFNEAILATWPQNIPHRLPLEAIFYRTDLDGTLAGAQFIQKDLFNTMGKTVPIVAYDPKAEGENAPFSYHPGDQVTSENSMNPR